jgi:polysaccharide biosynthesis protein PslH
VRILWVKGGKLVPPNTGGKLRTLNILQHLAKRHELTLLSYYGGHRDEKYERAIVAELPGTVVVYTAAPDVTMAERVFDYARRLPSRAPYAVTKFTDRRVGEILAKWFPERRFDVAICDFLCSSLNFPRHLATPTVLFQHNVETVLWRRKVEHEARWIDRVIARIEFAKMRRYEPAAVRRFHHVIAVSENDRQEMLPMVDGSRITVVPTGVDLRQFQPVKNNATPKPLVVFTGSMDWEANIDGVEFFCQQVWPRVLRAVPEARFRIVGKDPHPRVSKLACETVEVTGTVPSVVEHLREAAVFVVPLRIGGGTRLKIYEAMAMGKAAVSTTLGAEGLDVEHGKDILLADDPTSFAESVLKFLRDQEMRQRFAAAATEKASRYDWSRVTDRFVEVLRQVANTCAEPGAQAESLRTVASG